jgi:DNA-directed RNA polymerase specialized sigma24 family protein
VASVPAARSLLLSTPFVISLYAALTTPRATHAWQRARAADAELHGVESPIDAVCACRVRDDRRDRLTLALIGLANNSGDGAWVATLSLMLAVLGDLERPIRAWSSRDDAEATIAVAVVDELVRRRATAAPHAPAVFAEFVRAVRRVLDRARPPTLDVAAWDASVEPVALHACALIETARALETLSYRDQALLLAHAVAGIPHADLAFLFRLQPTAVRMRVGRARQWLRDRSAGPR